MRPSQPCSERSPERNGSWASPPDRPLTDAAIVRRRLQIAVLLGLLGLVAVVAMFAAPGVLQLGASVFALGFGWYALEKERHLQRLARLRGDANTISLVVADELVFSGALEADRELLDLRLAIERSAVALAAGLAEVLPTDCARPGHGSVGRGPDRGRAGPGPGPLPARRHGNRAPRWSSGTRCGARAVTIGRC